MTTKERLKKIVSEKGYGQNAFEKKIGIAVGYLASKSQSITSDTIEKVLLEIPDLNLVWLLTGEGTMLKDDPIKATDSSSEAIRLKDDIKSLKEELKESYKEIGRLEGENNLLREQLRLGDRKNEKSA